MNHKRKIHPHAEEVITRYSDMVFRVALSRTGNYNDAEDITQEVFLKYIQKNKGYEDWEHIKAWLIRVTMNLSKNLVTSAWNRHTVSWTEMIDVGVEPPESSELLEAVQRLPEKYREIIRLHYLKGYRVEEISQQLGLKESTVKTRLSRGRKRLRELLGALVVCVVTAVIGVTIFWHSGGDWNDREEIPNIAGVVTGGGVYTQPDYEKIKAALNRDTTIVERSKYADFRDGRKLSREEKSRLRERIQELANRGDKAYQGNTWIYYKVTEESGKEFIFHLKE